MQIRFFDTLVEAISTKYVSLHLVNKSGPPDPSHPCKRQSLSWHGHGCLIALPGPRLRLSVSAILSRHRLSAPTLFFHGLPSRGEEGRKAKRNHFRRISHSHFPQGSGDRPKCRVAKIGRDGGCVGELFLEEAQELPGSVLGCEGSSHPHLRTSERG